MTSLSVAEERALAETAEHAGLQDGQRVLELGCGWGSLTLWMAEHFPASNIVAVSNSRPQREFIEADAMLRGLHNVKAITADMNTFEIEENFDRVVSVEMFEHMSNWSALLARVHGWLDPKGLLFLHVFSHRTRPYRFDRDDKADWIAKHFFTGGVMPSHGLLRELDIPFEVTADWRWNGMHYRRTAEDWLRNFDANEVAIGVILRQVYGSDAARYGRGVGGCFPGDGGVVWCACRRRVGHQPLRAPAAVTGGGYCTDAICPPALAPASPLQVVASAVPPVRFTCEPISSRH